MKAHVALLLSILLPGGALFATAQEPATVSLTTSRVYAASAADLWAVVGDFGNVRRFAVNGVKTETSGSGIGMTRSMILTNGFRITDQLEALDPTQRVMTYSVIDSPALPYTNYHAVITVTPHAASGCLVSWSAHFVPRPGAEAVARRGVLFFFDTYLNSLLTVLAGDSQP